MTKKKIVEEFLGKMRQRYPRCATTFVEVDGDGFASVSLAVGTHVISLEIDYDAPKYHGRDTFDIFDKDTNELLLTKTIEDGKGSFSELIAVAEKAFVAFVEHELGHAGNFIMTNQEEDARLEKRRK